MSQQRRRKTSQLAKLPLPIALVVIGIYLIATFVFPAEEDYVPQAGSAAEQLETLEIKGRAPQTGYSRDEFGDGWLDPDGNGCDGRNDILSRDLESVIHDDDGCTVLTGVLQDPFTATAIDFMRGAETSQEVQIDHVVALSDAWQKGAQQLSEEQRERFANDPLNLLAVDGPANQQKSDGDAATWLPPNTDFRCEYVAVQTAVKAKYELWVTQAEYDAIRDVLTNCPDEPVYTTSDELPLLRR
ncbi:MAG: HNH endonuclease [Micrococcaceae bacterium]|nr:HNH endonuclease [Micrococcaceae bacterium]